MERATKLEMYTIGVDCIHASLAFLWESNCLFNDESSLTACFSGEKKKQNWTPALETLQANSGVISRWTQEPSRENTKISGSRLDDLKDDETSQAEQALEGPAGSVGWCGGGAGDVGRWGAPAAA